jgi:hypothetical protein
MGKRDYRGNGYHPGKGVQGHHPDKRGGRKNGKGHHRDMGTLTPPRFHNQG